MSELALERIRKAKKENLNVLDLSGCDLTILPDELFDLKNLKKLNLCANKINGNVNFGDMPKLETLDVSFNNIDGISDFQNLNELKELIISNNNITDLSFLNSLDQLETLVAISNNITSIPVLKELPKLDYVILKENKINNMSTIKYLKDIGCLDISHNKISQIPVFNDIFKTSLLDISYNEFTEISNLTQFPELYRLEIGFNNIVDISILRNLTKLEEVDIRNNKINDISVLKDLPQLRVVELEHNPIHEPPSEIIDQGIDAIRSYYKQVEKREKEGCLNKTEKNSGEIQIDAKNQEGSNNSNESEEVIESSIKPIFKDYFNKCDVKKKQKELKDKGLDETSVKKIITRSKKIFEILNNISKLTKSDTPVLILGESGVGKSLIAELIHKSSGREKGNYFEQNVATINPNLFESLFFGHLKGSFTGADREQIGLFKACSNGTLFLDEIGDLSPENQAKLLTFIENRKITPVGSTKTEIVNTRLIFATNKSLQDKYVFRQDLYFRISTFRINLPPLRERKEDIPLLVEHFSEKYSNKKIICSKQAMHKLENFHWEGNIRELNNVIENIITLKNPDIIKLTDLPKNIRKYKKIVKETSDNEIIKSLLEEAEQELGRSHGAIGKAYEIGRKRYEFIRKRSKDNFYYKVKRL